MKEQKNSEPASNETAVWRFANAEFDELKWQLRVNGAPFELEPRPLEILLCLLRHAGETVTKEELLQAVWGHSYLSENALSNAVGKLRKALRDDSQNVIVTVHKVGYRLAVPVVRQQAPLRLAPRLGLQPGDEVPGRPDWRLDRALGTTPGSEVWLARPASGDGAAHVFKFSPDGQRLPSLKREAALSRLLQSALGEHEEFVRVLDWGFDRPPFFIECEYGGISLPEWLERRGGLAALGLKLRVELLAQVAEAVALAHSVGVLHKDLKPANVLIHDRADGAPRVRLTDFGSGTLTDPARLAEWGISRIGTGHTQQAISGTPLYLAPELLLGHSPTVQSDLYALGVMLYQLAIGDLRRPLAPGWERDIGDELLRQDIADAACGAPEHRLTSARELADRLLRLEQRRQHHRQEQERRTAALAAQRALERTQARRPWLVAAGVALTLGLATSLWFFRQTLMSRNEERREAAVVRAVNGFLNNDLLAAANPNIGGSMDVTVRDAIAKASGRIDARFVSSPQLAVVLHQTVGSAYRTLGQYADAEREFRNARSLAYTAFGPDAAESLTSDLLLAQDLAYQNQYREAQSLLARIDTMAWNHAVPDPLIPLRLWDVHTLLDGHRTNRLAAAADAEQALAALEDLRLKHPATYKSNQDYLFLARMHIGNAFLQAGQNAQAEGIQRQLVTELAAERGANDPLTLQAREKWLAALIGVGRVGDAAQELPALERDVLAVSGHESPLQLELVRVQARLAAAQGHWMEAQHYSGRVENGYSRLFGVNNDASILAMANSAAILRASGQADAAVGKYLEAYGLAQSRQGDNGLLVQELGYDLAAASLDAGQAQQASLYLNGLNPAALSAAAPDRDWSARMAYQRGRAAQELGRTAEAHQDFLQALQLAQRGHDSSLAAKVEKLLAGGTAAPARNQGGAPA